MPTALSNRRRCIERREMLPAYQDGPALLYGRDLLSFPARVFHIVQRRSRLHRQNQRVLRQQSDKRTRDNYPRLLQPARLSRHLAWSKRVPRGLRPSREFLECTGGDTSRRYAPLRVYWLRRYRSPVILL